MFAIFLHRPIRAARFQSLKLKNYRRVFVRRLKLFGRFECMKSLSWDNRRRHQGTMEGLDRAGASTSEGGVQSFEQEALVGRSLHFGDGGFQAALNSLSKWFVAALFCAIIILRHDEESLWAASGAVINVILSRALKKVLNQERPFSTSRSDPGMPSSHAQSIFYTFVFLSLTMMESFGLNGITAVLCGVFFILSSFFSWLRVSQQFHSVSQIIVGAVLGLLFSFIWFWSWKYFILALFVSSLWVRIVVVGGAAGCTAGFICYVIQSWVKKEWRF